MGSLANTTSRVVILAGLAGDQITIKLLKNINFRVIKKN